MTGRRHLNDTRCAELYTGGVSVVTIAQHFGVNREAVTKALHRRGVKLDRRVRRLGVWPTELDLRRLASVVNMTFTVQPDDVANRRVFRDPCIKCGVRGDVSCKHREAA